jgi:hypothetical protein
VSIVCCRSRSAHRAIATPNCGCSARTPAAAPPLSEHFALPLSLKRALARHSRYSSIGLARETMASFAWNNGDLHCYSVVKPSQIHTFVRVVFALRAATKHESRPMAAGESLNLAGPTGLEPATSGVTGRRSNQLNYDPAS